MFPDLAALDVNFSRDGKWVALSQLHFPKSELWRARSDGSGLLQLTTPPLSILMHVFSPDASRIAVMAKFPGQPYKVYWISADGGTLHELPSDVTNEADPNWSADGQSIIFGEPPDFWADSGKPKAIYVSDLRTTHTAKIPASEGWFSPRISPDGRYLAALSIDFKRIGLFDFSQGRWRDLQQTDAASSPFWSPDGKWVYYNDATNRVSRVRVADRHSELVLSPRELLPNRECMADGFTPDQALILTCLRRNSDIYSLDWK
jgi:Tol biopolymer transport system component